MQPQYTYMVFDESMRSATLASPHIQEILNNKAAEGWELHQFTFDTAGGRCFYIFKKLAG